MMMGVFMVVAIGICCGSVFSSEPFTLGFSLISVCLMVCLLMVGASSSLLAFLVFMSYVSGVMILFLYVLSVHPNQLHSMSSGKKFLCFFSFVLGILVWYGYGDIFVEFSGLEGFCFVGMSSYWSLFLFMGLVLLFVLFVVCYLCKKKRLPLRSIV
uniref:NADH dehydrogenase subunit 6 n=1 Tax=Mytilisepta keenae TaxID=2590091 RepID=A0A516EZD6_9BIVA|nr:NADH dehydrogenase subunit 6 [Mytilisepta keenae]QDO71863.1 NADH dehydrogenase subunit 6 [Mytilisepta keenae]